MKNLSDPRTEEELLLAFSSGDVNALETLLIQKRDWISAVARKIIRDSKANQKPQPGSTVS
jgi:hypothetical protein